MKKTLLFFFCNLSLLSMMALAPPLEREINLNLVNEPVEQALEKIQQQTSLVFSYRPSIIQNIGPVTLNLKQKTVREALALIFPKTISYKQKNNYIILKEKALDKDTRKTEVSGYVVDKNTNKKVANVTIYDKKTLTAVTTDEYGYYSITVPKDEQCLKVNKENYQDTCVPVNRQESITNISINPVSDSLSAKPSENLKGVMKDLGRAINEQFRQFKGYINTLNIKDTLNRNWQLSLLPFLGSNGILSGNIYNDFSFNIIGGYSRGNRELEIGGLFNLNKEKMKGVQLAGAFNVVGDTCEGVQLAGLMNVSGKQAKGFQASGFLNVNIGGLNGVQMAGMMNTNFGEMKGVQGAGALNINHSVNGVALSGAVNVTRYSVRGGQAAGLLNISGDTLEGFSIAGLANLNWHSKGSLEMAGLFNHDQSCHNNVQIAGFLNTSGKGSAIMQLSSFLNVADTITGLQVGFINYSNDCKGVPIGFLSVVKGGLHQFELASDELFLANIAFRTGVHRFHNIFTAGFSAAPGAPLWHLGYGIGHSSRISKKWRLDMSSTALHVSKGAFYHATSELFRFYAGAEYTVAKKFTVAAGPQFNLYWTDALLPEYDYTYSNIAPSWAMRKNLANSFTLDSWLGARIALRFL